MKEIRKMIIREMIRGGKVYKSFKTIHNIIFLMEQYNYSVEMARSRLGLKSKDINRHNLKLYFLRRELYDKTREIK